MKAYPTLEGTPLPPPRKHSRWRNFIERRLPGIVIFLMVLTLIAVVLYPYMVVSVPSAQVGVLWKRFGGGTQLDRTALRGEGLHILLPWDKLFLYDLRLQSLTETAVAVPGASAIASLESGARLAIGGDGVIAIVDPGAGDAQAAVRLAVDGVVDGFSRVNGGGDVLQILLRGDSRTALLETAGQAQIEIVVAGGGVR